MAESGREGGLGSAPRREAERERVGNVAVAAMVAVALIVLWGNGRARADDCPFTDPECLTATVEKAVDSAVETIDETKVSGEDDVEAVVEDVERRIEDLLLRGGEEEPPGEDPPDGHSLRDPKEGTEPRSLAGDGARGNGGGIRRAGRRAPATTIPAEASTSDPILARGPGVRGGRLLENVKGLVFPIALVIAVVLYLIVQRWIDRNDPKLALAPATEALERFR